MQNGNAVNLPGLKRSVERTKRTRARAQSLGNSPVLAKKRTRDTNPEEESYVEELSPPRKKMVTSDAILTAINQIKDSIQGINNRLRNSATKEDITCMRTELRKEIKESEDRVKAVETKQEVFQASLETRITRVFDKRIADLKASRTGILTLTHEEMEEKRLFL